jgi:maltodextrin utilization protein YvdJ|tara:strand:+ start:363 stop:881 length:519 start_codon:yes stop_codon:yes gene_type:complete
MLRRLKFFGAGALISILFLSMGPENRMKDTFYAYIDYFNPEKRVVDQLLISDSIIYNDVSSVEIENILEGAWVNHDLTNKSSYPQFFVIENIIDEKNRRVSINFYDREERKDSVGDLKRYTKSEIISVEEISQISSRSYKSYFSLIGIFLVIMIPVSLLVRKLIRKRSLEDE